MVKDTAHAVQPWIARLTRDGDSGDKLALDLL